MRKENTNSVSGYLISTLFVLIGVVTAVCTVMYLLGVVGYTTPIQFAVSVGAFLFQCFHIGAFLIAAYFFIAAVLVSLDYSVRSLFFELVSFSLPILTFSLGIRVLVDGNNSSPIIRWVSDSFGVRFGASLSFLITIAIVVLIIQLRGRIIAYARKRDGKDYLALTDTRSSHNAKNDIYIHPATAVVYAPASPSTPTPNPIAPTPTPTTAPTPTADPTPSPATATLASPAAAVELPSVAPEPPVPSPVALLFNGGRFYDDPHGKEKDGPRPFTPVFLDPSNTENEQPAVATAHTAAPATTAPAAATTAPAHQTAQAQNDQPVVATTHTITATPQQQPNTNATPITPAPLTLENTTPTQTQQQAQAPAPASAVAFSEPMDAPTDPAAADATTAHQTAQPQNDQPTAVATAPTPPHTAILSPIATVQEAEPRWYLDPQMLLTNYPRPAAHKMNAQTAQTAEKLLATLKEFNIDAEVIGIRHGPAVTVYELLPARGVKLTKISALADNISLSLAAPRVRIVAPIPGKQAVGIELPNETREVVGFDTLVSHDDFQDTDNRLPIALGKGVSGEVHIIDLASTPHLLIAGATGSGKSVCVNAIISSLLFRCSPQQVRMLLIDPKIVELKLYNDMPHLISPVVTDTKEAMMALNYCIAEMENRYRLLDEFGVRDIAGYNRTVLSDSESDHAALMPYIVVVIDEFADLMITGGKQLEVTVSRLTAMSRAVGIHLILATQRPSTDVITGLIKANIPTRIAFMVASKIDSRIILDSGGAEQLLGQGDMLFVSSWEPTPIRMQGALITDEEVGKITTAVKSYGPPAYINIADQLRQSATNEDEDGEDALYDEALQIVQESGKASASYLQRRLQIGYNRAARIIEEMEDRGVVGPPNGSKAREVL